MTDMVFDQHTLACLDKTSIKIGEFPPETEIGLLDMGLFTVYDNISYLHRTRLGRQLADNLTEILNNAKKAQVLIQLKERSKK